MTEKVVIIIPAHNEEQYLPHMLSSLQLAIKDLRISTEPFHIDRVVVIDDGSKDNTAKIAEQFGAQVITLDRNYGKTFAFYKGVQEAKRRKAEIVVTLDADLHNITPRHLYNLVLPITEKETSMTIGKVVNDTTEHSGQRAIRMTALEPLLNHNPKWEAYFGLQKGKVRTRAGFGLENALNRCLGFVKNGRFDYEKKGNLPTTFFETQRGIGVKKLKNNTVSDYAKQMEIEMKNVKSIETEREMKARSLREKRRQNAQKTRKEHLKKIGWKKISRYKK